MLEALVTLLVPLEVSDHLLLLEEDPRVAVQTMEVFSVVEVFAVGAPALDAGRELLHVFRVVHLRLRFGDRIGLGGLLRGCQGLRHHGCERREKGKSVFLVVGLNRRKKVKFGSLMN